MDLTDKQWALIEPLFEAKRRADGRGRLWRDPRDVLNGVLCIAAPAKSRRKMGGRSATADAGGRLNGSSPGSTTIGASSFVGSGTPTNFLAMLHLASALILLKQL
jgi:hypothetical protein